MAAEMCLLKSLFFSSLLIILTSGEIPIKGAIGFPESEENPNLVNKENRTPVFLPAMCKENELYYPGDQKDDWICDCRPGHLYHPKTNTCWPAFRKGPCNDGQYLVLPKDSIIPTCYINPCNVDNLVMWSGKCEQLGSMAPCGPTFPAKVLWTNASNLELECVSLTNVENIPGVSRTPPTECPPGCKRSILHECVPVE